jgi:hypothetical protein
LKTQLKIFRCDELKKIDEKSFLLFSTAFYRENKNTISVVYITKKLLFLTVFGNCSFKINIGKMS